MSDCIDRELLKSKIRAAFPSLEDRCRINEIVNGVPAADVAKVKHGKWVNGRECSVCGFDWFDWFYEWEIRFNRTNYCPNCGAKMDEEGEE